MWNKRSPRSPRKSETVLRPRGSDMAVSTFGGLLNARYTSPGLDGIRLPSTRITWCSGSTRAPNRRTTCSSGKSSGVFIFNVLDILRQERRQIRKFVQARQPQPLQEVIRGAVQDRT